MIDAVAFLLGGQEDADQRDRLLEGLTAARADQVALVTSQFERLA